MPVRKAKAEDGGQTAVRITPIDMRTLEFYLEGTGPGLVVSRFSQKAQLAMQKKQEAGSTSKSSTARDPRDFDADYEGSKYISEEGWCGVNAACFRNAMISVCKAANMVMTRAKLAIFIEEDGFDKFDGTPLVRIYGEPEKWVSAARNADLSFDLRSRARWRRWAMKLTVRYDAGIVTAEGVTNLLVRVGVQAGICEGRPDSKKSAGMGMGLFRVVNEMPKELAA